MSKNKKNSVNRKNYKNEIDSSDNKYKKMDNKNKKNYNNEINSSDNGYKKIDNKNKRNYKKVEKNNEKKEDEIVKTEEYKKDTTSISIINTKELNNLIDEDLGVKQEKKKKENKHIFLNLFLIILLFTSLFFFGLSLLDKSKSILYLINNLLLTLFTIGFVVVSVTYKRKHKVLIFFCSLLLLGYFLLGINDYYHFISSYISPTPDFSGKSITEVIKWANKNKITINQEYEYSDMIDEYNVISQDVKSGTNLDDVKEITVSISEGPNPAKEIIVPSMVTWDTKRVINYVKENYLSNVEVEFVESDKAKDTVIEQSTSGNLKRNDELKLTFSYGEELGFEEVTLIDFTNKSKFEVEFYMKQNQLRYDFSDDFDKKIKKGLAIKQDVAAGEVVKINDKRIVVTISKGPKIKVPDLTKMSLDKVTEWAIKNKIKLSFIDSYDDSVKENDIIKFNHSKGDIIEQGSVIEIVLSRGSLKMPKFKSLNDFYNWANKYDISYEEQHEFSDTIKAGEVISYSYKKGDTIKNGDTIKVVISDGKKLEVPNLKGLTKSEAISKLNKIGLKYNFTYKSSSTSKDKVINQSISAGSEITSGTTITVTLSNGKGDDKEEKEKEKEKKVENKTVEKNSSNTNNSNSTKNDNNTNSSNNNENDNQSTTNNCKNVTVYIDGSHIDSNPATTCSKIKGAYSSLKFTCNYSCGPTNGLLLNSSSIDEHTFSTCDTITLRIADSSKC